MEQTTNIPIYVGADDGREFMGHIRPFDIQPVGRTTGSLIGGGPTVAFDWAYGKVSAVVADSAEDAEFILRWFAPRESAETV